MYMYIYINRHAQNMHIHVSGYIYIYTHTHLLAEADVLGYEVYWADSCEDRVEQQAWAETLCAPIGASDLDSRSSH